MQETPGWLQVDAANAVSVVIAIIAIIAVSHTDVVPRVSITLVEFQGCVIPHALGTQRQLARDERGHEQSHNQSDPRVRTK